MTKCHFQQHSTSQKPVLFNGISASKVNSSNFGQPICNWPIIKTNNDEKRVQNGWSSHLSFFTASTHFFLSFYSERKASFCAFETWIWNSRLWQSGFCAAVITWSRALRESYNDHLLDGFHLHNGASAFKMRQSLRNKWVISVDEKQRIMHQTCINPQQKIVQTNAILTFVSNQCQTAVWRTYEYKMRLYIRNPFFKKKKHLCL